VSTALAPIAVYGKVPGGDEFRLFCYPGPGTGPAAIPAGPAGDWLGLFLRGGNQAVCAVQRVSNRWWLFRVGADPYPDGNGRPTGFVVVAGLPNLPTSALAGVLLRAVQAPLNRDAPPTALADAPLTPVPSPAAALAALALATGSAVATVPGFDEAAAVLATDLPVEWVAFLPDHCQTVPAPGPGVVISKDRTSVPNEVVRLLERHTPAAILALPLSQLPADPVPARRYHLVGAALGEPVVGLVVDQTAADWLTATNRRAAAVAQLSAGAVNWWLESGRACADDLSELADRLGPEHREAVSRLLAGRPNSHTDYLKLYPEDWRGAVALLSADDLATWNRLADPGAGRVEPEAVDHLLAAVNQTPLAAYLGLGRLGAGVAAGSRQAVAPFLAALAQEGVPSEIGSALLTGGGVPAPPAGQAPVLRPRVEWLAPIHPANWLTAGRAFTDAPWREWWREGVMVLFRRGGLTPAEMIATATGLGDTDLLTAAGAPASVTRFVGGTGPVALPPVDGPWPDALNELLGSALADGSLFTRVAGPLGEDAFEWLASRGPQCAPAAAFLAAVHEHQPADPQLLLAAAPVLARNLVLQQTAAWGTARCGAQRTLVLAALLESPALRTDEAQWLRGLLLRCDPLPPCPHWSVADLCALLPVLDPIRDVVRQVLDRPERDPHETALLAQLLTRLMPVPSPPGPFPEVALRVRPDWVLALARLPGWEWVAGPTAAATALALAARAAHIQWGRELPDSVQRALALLMEAHPE
jgi:hypothetical protein